MSRPAVTKRSSGSGSLAVSGESPFAIEGHRALKTDGRIGGLGVHAQVADVVHAVQRRLVG